MADSSGNGGSAGGPGGPCNTRPPGYVRSGVVAVAMVYPGVLVIPGNRNRLALTFSRSSPGGDIYISPTNTANPMLTINDYNTTLRLELATWGDIVQGAWFAYGNGGGISLSWSEMLCYPC